MPTSVKCLLLASVFTFFICQIAYNYTYVSEDLEDRRSDPCTYTNGYIIKLDLTHEFNPMEEVIIKQCGLEDQQIIYY